MKTPTWTCHVLRVMPLALGLQSAMVAGDEQLSKTSSYPLMVINEDFATIMKRMTANKLSIEQAHKTPLEQCYDPSDRPVKGANMTRGKPLQEGGRVKLPAGTSWEELARLSPEEIRKQELFPGGSLSLPHPNHVEGGMISSKFLIDEIKRQESRDLTHFDPDCDLPDHSLPEFPVSVFLTIRPDLSNVPKDKLVTIDNYFELPDGILNPKQPEGLRLLLTTFPQQQFNFTDDCRSEHPSRGVACFDCHANGHTNAATHLAGGVHLQPFRHRIDVPTLCGINIQRLFDSQRVLKTAGDFTELEQRAAYFDGDPVIATKKGVNALGRGSQVYFMDEFQALLDFPSAPKLDVEGRLDPGRTSERELCGEKLFYGKAACTGCRASPYFTDSLMHDLKVERFYDPKLVNGVMASADGPIKTFPLCRIKDSPPYLHDDRPLTLEDMVEFFNLVLECKLSVEEKGDLMVYLRTL